MMIALRWHRAVALTAAAILCGLLAGEAHARGQARRTAVRRPLELRDLPGWRDDHQAEAWEPFLRTCDVLARRDRRWHTVCAQAQALPKPNDATARRFFETRFAAYEVRGDRSRDGAFVTAYFEPLVRASLRREGPYRYPLYRPPSDLHDRRRAVSRAEIEGPGEPLAGSEIMWLDDPFDRYLVHVEGSGKARLTDGQVVAVDYADQNGLPFRPIGARLAAQQGVPPSTMTVVAIREWLTAHPADTAPLIATDPGYVFFRFRRSASDGPLGAMGLRLTPYRSIAVDPRTVPLGAPMWLLTKLHGARPVDYRKLVVAQDTGGAIKGPGRVDLYVGEGADAELLAGNMREDGRLFVLLPRTT
jgi:membrane-bound lytic murein transglycosylase A